MIRSMTHYLDQAVIFCFKSIFEIHYEEVQLDFEEYFLMKLMSKSEDLEVSNYAAKILAKNKNSITAEKILAYDIPSFIRKVSRDVANQFATVSTEFIETYPETRAYLFNQFTLAAKILLKEFNMEHYSEQNVLFYPRFLDINIKSIHEEDFKLIFDFLIRKCCKPENPMLMDQSLNIGVKILHEYSAQHAEVIVEIFNKYLQKTGKKDHEQELINSLVFISICAPQIKDQSKIDAILSKVLAFSSSKKFSIHNALAKCLPDLTQFMKNPKEVVDQMLKKIATNKNKEENRGAAYVVAGILKGLGVRYFDEFGILDFLQKNTKKAKFQERCHGCIELIHALYKVLGKSIEPYSIQFLPILTGFFGLQDK